MLSMKYLEDRNQGRSRRYGKWIGDMVKVTPFEQTPYLSEVICY